MKTYFHPKHFLWQVETKVATITLNRPERKNPLTFESYAELRDLFRDLRLDTDIKAVVVAGAGAILAMISDLRLGTARSKTAFLFTRVGLAGCDMGACTILPRLIGQGRASDLLYSGRSMNGEEALAWGFFNRLCEPEAVLAEAQALAQELAAGPSFAHGMTKTMLHQEWAMGVDEAIEAEAQAFCMQTQDFRRAYEAFAAKQKPVFEGN